MRGEEFQTFKSLLAGNLPRYWWREQHLTLWAIKTQSFLIKILDASNQITFGERLAAWSEKWISLGNERNVPGGGKLWTDKARKNSPVLMGLNKEKNSVYIGSWHGDFCFCATPFFWALMGRGGEAWRHSGTDRSWLHCEVEKGTDSGQERKLMLLWARPQ